MEKHVYQKREDFDSQFFNPLDHSKPGELKHEEVVPIELTFDDEPPESSLQLRNKLKKKISSENTQTQESGLQKLKKKISQPSVLLGAVLGLSLSADTQQPSSTKDYGMQSESSRGGYGKFNGNGEEKDGERSLEEEAKELVESEVTSHDKLIDFHLHVLELKGDLTQEEKQKTKEFILGLIQKYRGLKLKNEEDAYLGSPDNTLSELFELAKDLGKYNPDMARVSDIALKGKGNCEARALMRRLIVPEVWWQKKGFETKFQWFGVDPNDPESASHVRMIMKVEESWYALEDGVPTKLLAEDFVDTQITDIDVFEKSILDQSVHTKPIKSSNELAPTLQKNRDTNTVYSIHFDHPATKPLPFRVSRPQEESDEAFQRRQRLEYIAGGDTLDPENLPPLKVYMAPTLEEVAAQMSEQKQKEAEDKKLDLEKLYPLSEKQKIDAMLTGHLDLSWVDRIYDLSPLHGVDIKKITFSSYEKNSKIGQKYSQEFAQYFPNIKEFEGALTNETASIIMAFQALEKMNILCEITDSHFFSHIRTLKELHISTSIPMDLAVFSKNKLEEIDLYYGSSDIMGISKEEEKAIKETFLNFSALDTSNLHIFTVDIPIMNSEIEKVLVESPVLETFIFNLGGTREFRGEIFGNVDSLKTKSLVDFKITGVGRKNNFFDLEKLKGQPLENLTVFAPVKNFEALVGMPLKVIKVVIDCEKTDISVLRSFPELYKLDLQSLQDRPKNIDEINSFLESLESWRKISNEKWHEKFGVYKYDKKIK